MVNSSSWYQEEQLRARLTIRVPAGEFDAAMARLKDLAIKVENRNVSTQDVTEEYTDLDSRLRNLEATETELLELLTEVRERTGKEMSPVQMIMRSPTGSNPESAAALGTPGAGADMSALSTTTSFTTGTSFSTTTSLSIISGVGAAQPVTAASTAATAIKQNTFLISLISFHDAINELTSIMRQRVN